MKLKEKLADEAAYVRNSHCPAEYFYGYLEGFEKARAMCIEYFKSCPDKLRGMPIEYSINAVIPGELMQLGEEESK